MSQYSGKQSHDHGILLNIKNAVQTPKKIVINYCSLIKLTNYLFFI